MHQTKNKADAQQQPRNTTKSATIFTTQQEHHTHITKKRDTAGIHNLVQPIQIQSRESAIT